MIDSVFKAINRLLPFATPGTPLTTDLLHLAALCTLLYFAPQIQHLITGHSQQPRAPTSTPSTQDDSHHAAPEPHPAAAAAAAPAPAPLPPPPPVADPDLPGPAHPDPTATRAPPSRPIGPKKAASLARRDQRRAYHEFQRSQADARRATDAATALEREAALQAEQARRAAVERALREAEAREREARRAEAERAEVEERGRREGVLSRVRAGLDEGRAVDLGALAGEVGREIGWVEGLVRAEGLVGARTGDGGVVMVTGLGWLVSVDRRLMGEVYRVLEEEEMVGGDEGKEGRFGREEVGRVLERLIRAR